MKKMYMIGNSHIDPVWFWEWEEGMQEVKATFASALDRMNEFEDFKFTTTSSAFFEWIEKINPKMFEEIQKRVAEGKFELTGGWFVEPDCNLPSGESFARQGLYGQRYFLEKFGKTCEIGSNVDSFGHNSSLPQLLKKSGMDSYVQMRPRLDEPVFIWESEDGSQVTCLSLPSEYTTWFFEPTREAIELTASKTNGLTSLPCCYGVGNHGGGPTIENINAIYTLKDEYKEKDIEMVFATLKEFFDTLTDEDKKKLTVKKGNLEKVNVGCYSIDSKFKKVHKLTEKRIVSAENMLAIESLFTGNSNFDNKKMERLWKTLLFNQFHDTLGGTAIKPARDEGIMQLHGVNDECKRIHTFAIQNMVNKIDTTGEGFPLFLFNPTGIDYDGPITVELNWFCQDGLILKDDEGTEIPYQRIHTMAKTRHYTLGGRRAITFNVKIPAFGFVAYRTIIGEATLYFDARSGSSSSPYLMEGDFIKVEFSKETGHVASIYDKENGYESLSEPMSYDIWKDERDAWGGVQGRPFYDTNQKFNLVKLETIEDGTIRKVVRGTYSHESSILVQHFILYKNGKELIVENKLHWDKPWHMLKFRMPVNVDDFTTNSEIPYNIIERKIRDNDEYFMHRFTDISENGTGLYVANDSKYAFSMEKNHFLLTILRSSIYAQGQAKNWYEPLENYEFTDIGVQKFKLILRPHKNRLLNLTKYHYANMVNDTNLYLADSAHIGEYKCNKFSNVVIDSDNVMITTMKKAEDDHDMIVRLIEIEGKETKFDLKIGKSSFVANIKANEILT